MNAVATQAYSQSVDERTRKASPGERVGRRSR